MVRRYYDFRLWMMEQHFARATTQHQTIRYFWKKTYLGGPDTHGGGACVCSGRVARSFLQEDVIRQIYQDIKVKKFTIKSIFR